MLCEHCKKNNATVHFRETVNGKSRSLSLCAECAARLRENGELPALNPFSGWDLPAWEEEGASLTDALFGGLLGGSAYPATRPTCPVCGARFEDIRRTGRLGCSACYTTFARELEPTVRSLHGDARHTGRGPAAQSEHASRARRLADLKNALDEAVRKEDYEAAIRLRDELRSLENENGKE
jgi:protein arginine kinase activator